MKKVLNITMKASTLLAVLLLAGCAGGAALYVEKYSSIAEERAAVEKLQAQEALRQAREVEAEANRRLAEVERTSRPASVPTTVYIPPSAPPVKPNHPEITGSLPPRVAPVRPITPKIKPKLADIDRSTVVGQLYEANAVFAVPGSANVRDEIVAQLLIDPVKDLPELVAEARGPVKAAERVKISRILVAKLDAPDFNIISATEAEQAVAENTTTEWRWTLRPKSAGVYPINIAVYAEVSVDGKTTKHKIRTFDKQVLVEVSVWQSTSEWWGKHWQWIFATLLIPLLKFGWDSWQKKGKVPV